MTAKKKKRAAIQPRPKSRVVSSAGLATRASEIEAERIEWLWRGRIARGNVTIIAGEPGLGKSQIAAKLAATVTKGRKWPHEEGSAPLGNVLMLSAEDAVAETVRPRLQAAGANLKRVYIIKNVQDETSGERPFDLVGDLNRLDDQIAEIEDVRLVVIDPLSACLNVSNGQSFNPNDVGDVRRLSNELDALAKKHDLAIVLICHLTKSSGGPPLSRIAGSSALGAAARAAFLVVKGDSKYRIFVTVKNNLGSDTTALRFLVRSKRLKNKIRTSRVVWSKTALEITAEEALRYGNGSEDRIQRSTCDDLLRTLLNGGTKPAKEMLEEGIQHGFSAKQMRNAARRAGVKFFSTGFGESKKWFWKSNTTTGAKRGATEAT
jgi:putative DNA primase/helicase